MPPVAEERRRMEAPSPKDEIEDEMVAEAMARSLEDPTLSSTHAEPNAMEVENEVGLYPLPWL